MYNIFNEKSTSTTMWESIIYTEWYSFSLETPEVVLQPYMSHTMSFFIFVPPDYYILFLHMSLDYEYLLLDPQTAD